ncbi:MAG: hypothetical protein PHF31_00050 [Methylobacter sp.]|nr:hypothetical protein [Methylobacter sp.]
MRKVALWVLMIFALQGCRESETEREREQAVLPTKASVAVIDGAAVVTLEEIARQKGGIATGALQAVNHQRMIRAFGVVLPIQEWVDLRNAYAAAKAQSESAQATVLASRLEYLRLKDLHADDRNTSERAMQLAEATWRSDEARAQATREVSLAIERNARQQWGEAVAQVIVDDSPLFSRVASLEEALVQVSVPEGESLASLPDTTRIQTSDGALIEASLITRLPRTDPRFQGTTLLYRVSRQSFDFAAGVNIPVFLPAGDSIPGVNIPAAAVVSWQGKAWVYIETSPGQFIRRELPADLPTSNGWFVNQGFSAAEAVVLKGAQLLLSQELLGQIQMGDEGD